MESHVFGPVPSRRLGRSLGVDIVPYKTCTYDCIYCQLGRTTDRTIERREWVSPTEVLEELKGKLDRRPDYVTLSGSGEPTLYSKLSELIVGIKSLTDVPIAVLTNGSLLWKPEVRRELMQADLVVPSLDAGSEEMFARVNRPHPEISFERMIDGLVAFQQKYTGTCWLEVFLIEGLTATVEEVGRIVKIVERIGPDRVQLNTVARPPTEEYALSVSCERMEQFAGMFEPKAEVIADYEGTHEQPEFAGRRQDVLDMVSRRPCTVDDIVAGLGLHRNEVVKYVDELVNEGKLTSEVRGEKVYYKAK